MKILIIRRDNIGDLICTTPLFEALRRRYPNAYLAALVNSYNAPAIQGNPHLDAVFAYTKGKHAAGESVVQAYLKRVKLLWSLRCQRFDYVLLPSSGFAPRPLAWLAWCHLGISWVSLQNRPLHRPLIGPFPMEMAGGYTKLKTCFVCSPR